MKKIKFIKKIITILVVSILLIACGSDDSGDNSGEQGGDTCDELFTMISGSGFVCDNSLFGDLEVNNIYIEEDFLSDEDGDGVNDHSFTRLYITDGTATLDANNGFVSFSDDRTYVFEIWLVSIGTNGLIADDFLPSVFVDKATESFYSYLGPIYYNLEGCDATEFVCGTDTVAPFGVVASLSGTPGNYDICFKSSYSQSQCFNGSFQGAFIPIEFP